MSRLTRPVVLVFNKYFAPGYRAGGPVRSLENLISRLGSEIDFRIVTQDRDVGDAEPYSDVPSMEWTGYKGTPVYYMPRNEVTIWGLARLFAEVDPDIIYLNSFLDPLFTQRILWARRLGLIKVPQVVLAPRGEFSPGALGLNRAKKAIYLRFARIFRLYADLVWQASTAREADEIRQSFPPARFARIELARDLNPPMPDSDPQPQPIRRGMDEDRLRICFLSRISPKKNLDYALRVLGAVDVPIFFTIYGPKGDQAYWDTCQSLAQQAGENIGIHFAGPIEPVEVQDYLAEHDLFYLPTRGENYGHVIFEALSAGLYTVISDQTPWQNLEARGVGKTLSLDDQDAHAVAIRDAAHWSPAQWQQMRQKAIAYARDVASDDEAVTANRKLFIHCD